MNQDSESLAKALGETLTEIPPEELEEVTRMNRADRRRWLKQHKKRGKGYTR